MNKEVIDKLSVEEIEYILNKRFGQDIVGENLLLFNRLNELLQNDKKNL